jgi:hypothetical protein
MITHKHDWRGDEGWCTYPGCGARSAGSAVKETRERGFPQGVGAGHVPVRPAAKPWTAVDHTKHEHTADGVDTLRASTNPKDALGVRKAPLRLVPPALAIEVAPAMANGADKYGAYNWREKDVRATVYGEAILRHLFAWMDGEDRATDSGVKHLGHLGACVAILLDAEANGNLVDDRPDPGPAARLLAEQDATGS